ncbi:MoaD/ThiS family protein [Dactylosporangium sp. NPDC050588]|uniref:MoaD/ThiS family protein n=1 Tax=Dactylosporangium sp. NPDC050588 TaxID=3157211 RepID=UPI003404B801
MTAVLLVRYFAGARAAAGVPEEKVEAATLGELVAVLTHDRPRLASVLTACSFLVDGTSWRDREAALPATATVDVLPPFAGG